MKVNIGDILIIENSEYTDDYTGNDWKNHFVLRRHAWRVDDITNGGRIAAHDFHGNKRTLHALDKPPCYPYIVRVIPA